MSFIEVLRENRESILRDSDKFHRLNFKQMMNDLREKNPIETIKENIKSLIVQNPLNRVVRYKFTIDTTTCFNTINHKYIFLESVKGYVSATEILNKKRFIDENEDVKNFISYLKDNFSEPKIYGLHTMNRSYYDIYDIVIEFIL